MFARTQSGSSVAIPERRVPAIRIELQRSDDGRSATLRQVLPATIEATPPERRLAVAIAQLLDHWGDHGEEFDFDGDGEVGPGDMDRANETL